MALRFLRQDLPDEQDNKQISLGFIRYILFILSYCFFCLYFKLGIKGVEPIASGGDALGFDPQTNGNFSISGKNQRA